MTGRSKNRKLGKKPWICFLAFFMSILGPRAIAEEPLPEEPAKPKSKWSGLKLEHPEHEFSLRINPLMQNDGLLLLEDENDQSDRFEIRRVRITLDGQIGRLYSFRLRPQWTPGNVVILDAYIDLRFLKELVLRIGKGKTPLGIEMLQPSASLLLPERGLSTSLVPNRDLGLQLFGEIKEGLLSYALGLGTGTFDQGAPEGNLKDEFDFYARVFLQPFRQTDLGVLRNLGLGLAGSFGMEHGQEDKSGLGRYRTGSRDTFASYAEGVLAQGHRTRLNPQFWWYWKSLGVMGEYVYSRQRVGLEGESSIMGHHAWMVGASYVLTQEDACYRGIKPEGDWGSLEIAGRFGELYLDKNGIQQNYLPAETPNLARAWGLSLNYLANEIVRWQLAFERTSFNSAFSDVRLPENALYLRLQVNL